MMGTAEYTPPYPQVGKEIPEYEHKDYPRMLYHVIEPQKTVNSEEEENEWIEKGWTISPGTFNERMSLTAEIKAMEESIRAKKARRSQLEKEEKAQRGIAE